MVMTLSAAFCSKTRFTYIYGVPAPPVPPQPDAHLPKYLTTGCSNTDQIGRLVHVCLLGEPT